MRQKIAGLFDSSKKRSTYSIIIAIFLLDLVGVSVIFPILAPLLLNPESGFFHPSISEVMKKSTVTALFAIFHIVEFFAAPINGSLSDRYGRKPLFVVLIGLNIVSHLLAVVSIMQKQLWMLFLARLLNGVGFSTIALSQSATADLTTKKMRPKAYGTLHGLGNFGSMVGSIIGSQIISLEWCGTLSPFFVAIAGALINLFLILFYFEDPHPSDKKTKSFNITDIAPLFQGMYQTFLNVKLHTVFLMNLLFCIGWGFFTNYTPIFLLEKFQASQAMIGYVIAYKSLIWILVTTLINSYLCKKFSLTSLIQFSIFISGIGLAFYAWIFDIQMVWSTLPFLVGGASIVLVNTTAYISIRADSKIQGRALGLNSSMGALGGTIAPLIAGPLSGLNVSLPFALGVIFILTAGFIFSRARYQQAAGA